MGRKNCLKIIAGIAASGLILAVLIIANLFTGNPLTAHLAKRKAVDYINERYGDLDLEIEKVTYSPKDGSYYVSVVSGSSIDTHFSMRYRDGAISSDDYEISVLSGMNTMERFCGEYADSLMPLLQAETDCIVNISVMPEKLRDYSLTLDAVFDKALVSDVGIAISCTGGTDAGYLSSILKTTRRIMEEKGYTAKTFAITGEARGTLTELWNIRSEHIEDENLEQLLCKAMMQGEYDGITAFSKGLK